MQVKLLRRGQLERGAKLSCWRHLLACGCNWYWKKRQTEKRKFRQAPRKVSVGNVLDARSQGERQDAPQTGRDPGCKGVNV